MPGQNGTTLMPRRAHARWLIESTVERAVAHAGLAAGERADRPRPSNVAVLQAIQVIVAAMKITPNLDVTLQWFEHDVIAELGGTALGLVLQGRHAQVMAFLERCARDMETDAHENRREPSAA